jgi:Ca2+-binding EF-hand superfamily protein
MHRRAEFQSALGMSNSTFVDQLFAVFDENGDMAINFTEFLTILSVIKEELWRNC